MNTTGTLESELPDNYSLKDFKGGDKKPKSSEYSEPVTKRGRTSGGFFS
jgi:hypothetical protein